VRNIKRREKVPSVFFCLICVACLFTLQVTALIFFHNNYATFFRAMPHIILDGTVDLERFLCFVSADAGAQRWRNFKNPGYLYQPRSEGASD